LQHGWPAAPHAWQDPLSQIDVPPLHACIGRTHVLLAGSQQPSWQAVPVVQHAWPPSPHEVPLLLLKVTELQLVTPACALLQLSLTAVVVAALSSVPSALHLMLATAQFKYDWRPGHWLTSCWHCWISDAGSGGSLGQGSRLEQDAPPLEQEALVATSSVMAARSPTTRAPVREGTDDRRAMGSTMEEAMARPALQDNGPGGS
jgi:hypothetical protein